jgi:hypothetical protein
MIKFHVVNQTNRGVVKGERVNCAPLWALSHLYCNPMPKQIHVQAIDQFGYIGSNVELYPKCQLQV